MTQVPWGARLSVYPPHRAAFLLLLLVTQACTETTRESTAGDSVPVASETVARHSQTAASATSVATADSTTTSTTESTAESTAADSAVAQPTSSPALPTLSATPTSLNEVERRFAPDSFWTAVWRRGGKAEPDMVIEPREMTLVGGVLVVLDPGSREVHAFDARTGATRWQLKSSGSGPGELRAPSGLAASPAGHVLVADNANARLNRFAQNGQWLGSVPLTDAFSIEGICPYPDGQSIIKLRGGENAILRFANDGALISRSSVPWSARDEEMTHWAAVAGPTSSGLCILARRYASTWATYSPTRGAQTHHYVERTRAPRVEVTERKATDHASSKRVERTVQTDSDPSAISAFVVGDTVIVRFAGTTRLQLFLLDYYHAPSGRYLFSKRLPMLLTGFAVGNDGIVYGSYITENYSGVVALRPRTTPPPPRPDTPAPPPAPRP